MNTETWTYVPWACDKCGASEDYLKHEQPIAHYKCLMGTANRAICGGIIKPIFGTDALPQRGIEPGERE